MLISSQDRSGKMVLSSIWPAQYDSHMKGVVLWNMTLTFLLKLVDAFRKMPAIETTGGF